MDAIDKIERLQKLLSSGAITQEEFESQKAIVLSGESGSNPNTVPKGFEEKERSYFNHGGVHITSTRAIFPKKTYAMANITSVSIGVIKPNRTAPLILLVIGLFLLPAITELGILTVVGSLVWLFMLKDEYTVRIGSASGEVDGLTSKNQEFIQRVVSAMNDAIINRG